MNGFQIQPVNEQTEGKAKELVLQGFQEHFGQLDQSLNQDLNGIVKNYLQNGDVFLTGFVQNELVATGALVQETPNTGRIVRMSVLKSYRRKGFARQILMELEKEAFSKGFSRLLLETMKDWQGVIRFYRENGFQVDDQNEKQIFFLKKIGIEKK